MVTSPTHLPRVSHVLYIWQGWTRLGSGRRWEARKEGNKCYYNILIDCLALHFGYLGTKEHGHYTLAQRPGLRTTPIAPCPLCKSMIHALHWYHVFFRRSKIVEKSHYSITIEDAGCFVFFFASEAHVGYALITHCGVLIASCVSRSSWLKRLLKVFIVICSWQTLVTFNNSVARLLKRFLDSKMHGRSHLTVEICRLCIILQPKYMCDRVLENKWKCILKAQALRCFALSAKAFGNVMANAALSSCVAFQVLRLCRFRLFLKWTSKTCILYLPI